MSESPESIFITKYQVCNIIFETTVKVHMSAHMVIVFLDEKHFLKFNF